MTSIEILRFGKLIKAYTEMKHPLVDIVIKSISNAAEHNSITEWLDIYEEGIIEASNVASEKK